MEDTNNCVLVQYASLDDIERMINRAVDKRIASFYEAIRERPPVLVRRKDAAAILGVSLPTLDAYARVKIIHSRHVGGRVFFDKEELLSIKGGRAADKHLPVAKE